VLAVVSSQELLRISELNFKVINSLFKNASIIMY